MESYNQAYALWLGVSESSQFKKTALFMATLAYKQKQWIIALEISKNLPGNPVIEHIKLLTLIEMQYYDEFIECLSSWSTDEKMLKIKLWKETVYSMFGTLCRIHLIITIHFCLLSVVSV